MSENAIRQLVRKVVAEELTPAVSTAKEQVGQLLQVPKRQNIEKYCEDLVRNGKLLRAEKARTIARLMRADTNPVFKFSEKKKTGETVQVKKSELDLQMEELEARPLVLKYAERIAQPLSSPNTEVAELKNHFRRFSEQYAKTGTNWKKMVGAFKKYRQQHPGATADQFLERASA